MAQFKHITNNSILGRYLYDKVTPVKPPTFQNIEINHMIFTNVTEMMINDGNQGYKVDKLSERFGV